MDIVYLGHSSFHIKGKGVSVITDPFDDSIGIKFPKVSADLVTVSHDHGDHSNTKAVSDVHKVFDAPGEYEAKEVSVVGFPTFHDDKKGSLRGKNTMYLIEMERIRLVHLGDLGHTLNEKQVDALGEVDVLFVPVGGEYTLGPEKAVEVVRAIEPLYTIPMHYKDEGLNKDTFGMLKGVDEFVSQAGMQPDKMNKLSIRNETLGEDPQMVILERK